LVYSNKKIVLRYPPLSTSIIHLLYLGQMLYIPLIRQDPKSDDCLRCCALMVVKFFGDKITRDEVWRKLHVYKKHSGLFGAYFSDLGRLALKKGYKAVIYHYDWHFWNIETVESLHKSTKSLLASLATLRKESKSFGVKREISKQLLYVKDGGKYIFEIPNLETIDGFLQKKIPVIISVWGQDFYKNPKEDYRHVIIVSGKDRDEYIIRDPYLALERINEQELDFALKRRGGWMMVIEPKLDTSKLKQGTLRF